MFLEYVQNASLPACARNILRPLGSFYSSEVLLADQELILGGMWAIQPVVSGSAADRDVALCELADDDGRLVAGLRVLEIPCQVTAPLPGYLIVAPI